MFYRSFKYIVLLSGVLALSACFVSGPVHFYEGQPLPEAETATLLIPGPITLKQVDGKDIDVPSVEEGNYIVYLLPGVHRIDFRYELYWGDNTSGMVITSDTEAIETLFNAGMSYHLLYHAPQDEHEAFWMSGHLNARLIEKDTGRKISARSTEELEEKGIRTELNQKE